MSTEARALDDVIDDGWEDVTKPYSVPAFVAALLEAGDGIDERCACDRDGRCVACGAPGRLE